MQLNRVLSHSTPLQEAKGIVGGTTGLNAIEAGSKILANEGNALDAALTTAVNQIVESGGSWNSFAGVAHIFFYDAKTKQVSWIDGGFNSIQGHPNSMSIPDTGGKTALVPGFIAGIEKAHQKFGKIPFRQILEDAIELARNGFQIDRSLASKINTKKALLAQRPETKQIFFKGDQPLTEGDRLLQPELADTLDKIARLGSSYFYKGEWAQRFVDKLRSEGSQITLDDMAAYEAKVLQPSSSQYGDYQVHTFGDSIQSGPALLESLNLFEQLVAGTPGGISDYTKSPELFATLVRFMRFSQLSNFYPEEVKKTLGFDASDRSAKDYSQRVFKLLQGNPDWEKSLDLNNSNASNNHSDGIVSIDSEGNMAAILHTINTDRWGESGIFVDGVSIPDAAVTNKDLLKDIKPGTRVALLGACPGIVTKNGEPHLAFSGIGGGVFEATLQNLVNSLFYNRGPAESVNLPQVLGMNYVDARVDQNLIEPYFNKSLQAQINESLRGQAVLANSHKNALAVSRGYWLGLQANNDVNLFSAALTRGVSGGFKTV